MNLGRAIRTVRSAQNINRRQLADRAGLSESYVSLMESGKRMPPLSTLGTVAEVLGLPVTLLVFLAEDHSQASLISVELRGQLSDLVLAMLRV